MAITLHATVIVDGRVEHASLQFEASGLATIGALFDRADADKRMGRRFFRRLLKRHRSLALTLLHNGRRLDLPAGLQTPLADGDELNLLTPAMGG